MMPPAEPARALLKPGRIGRRPTAAFLTGALCRVYTLPAAANIEKTRSFGLYISHDFSTRVVVEV